MQKQTGNKKNRGIRTAATAVLITVLLASCIQTQAEAIRITDGTGTESRIPDTPDPGRYSATTSETEKNPVFVIDEIPYYPGFTLKQLLENGWYFTKDTVCEKPVEPEKQTVNSRCSCFFTGYCLKNAEHGTCSFSVWVSNVSDEPREAADCVVSRLSLSFARDEMEWFSFGQNQFQIDSSPEHVMQFLHSFSGTVTDFGTDITDKEDGHKVTYHFYGNRLKGFCYLSDIFGK